LRGKASARSLSGGLKDCIGGKAEAKHSVEKTSFVKIEKLVTTADQVVIDVDYRDGLPLASLPHFCCHERIVGDIMLGKSHPLDAQEFLGSSAVSTIMPGIDFYYDFHRNRSGINLH